VISRYYENADELDKGYVAVLKFISGKEVKVSSKTISSHKLLSDFLNQEKVATSESEARRIANYIVKFIRLNKDKIPRNYYSTRIGWGKVHEEEIYIHPETYPIDVFISTDIEEKLVRKGSREKELEAVKSMISQYPHAGLIWIMEITASVLRPLLRRDYNLVIMLQGESGSGKTTAIKCAVSFYAHPELKRRFGFTEGGFEGFISRLKDFPIHLEEVKDIDKNPQKRAEKFVDFVYAFVGEDAKVRMNIDLTLRKTEKYKGLIFTSSEIDIEEILSYTLDSYREGLKRRLLIVPAEKEKFGGKRLAKLVEVLYDNHTNLLSTWMDHFNRNRERIEKAFKEREADFMEGYSKLDAKFTRFLAAVSVVMEEVEKLFGIDVTRLWTVLEEVGSFNEEIYSGEENFKEKVERVIDEFDKDTLVEEEDVYGRVKKIRKEPRTDILLYRRVRVEKEEEVERIVERRDFLTAKGLEVLAVKLGMSENVLKKRLIEFGIAEEDEEEKRTCKREKKTILYLSKRKWVYPINLNPKEDKKETEEEQIMEGFKES